MWSSSSHRRAPTPRRRTARCRIPAPRGGNHVAAPDTLAGLQLERIGVPAHPELAARASDDHHVLHDQRGDRRALTGPHVPVRLVPDELAVRRVERDHVGVEGGHEDLPIGHRTPAVDVAAAQAHVVRRCAVIAPQLLTGLGVDRPDPAVKAGDEHDAVNDQRGRLHRVRRRAGVHAHRAALEHPGGAEILDVALVDLIERAVTLPVVGAVVRDPVVRLCITCLEDAVVVDALGHSGRLLGQTGAQNPVVDRCPCVNVFSCHQLLPSTAAVGVDGLAWLRRGPRHRRRSCR